MVAAATAKICHSHNMSYVCSVSQVIVLRCL